MKKKKLPTYTVLIRTPSGTEIMTKTNDFAKARSKTFPGIAKAMAEQWGKY